MSHHHEGRRPTILWLTHGLPYPPRGGAQLRDFHLIRQASRHATILLVSLLESPDEAAYIPCLRDYCALVEGVVPERRTPWRHGRALVGGLLAGRPAATHPFVHEAMMAKIRALGDAWPIDIVQIEHSFLAPYVEAIGGRSGVRTILSFHNLGVTQYRQMWRLRGQSAGARALFVLKWLLLLGWEARYAGRFDRALAVSALEGERLRAANPRLAVAVIENGVDSRRLRPLAEASDGAEVLFVGTLGYAPNADAVLAFVEEIMPLVRRAGLAVRLTVVGRRPPPAVRRLAARADVIVAGDVDDVTPFYQRARVVIVPLRAGGGTRLKILEAMALGRPVVSTTLGREGLEVVDGVHLLIADTPRAFADCLIRLLTEASPRIALALAARRLVETRYDWEVIGERLREVHRELLAEPSPAAPGRAGA